MIRSFSIRTTTPGKELFINDEYNLWKGWGCEPKKGDITPWRDLLDYIFKGETKARRWFERWCAYQFQNPGKKLFTACLIWGVHTGTGKSLIGYTLGRIFGENFTEIGQEHLQGNFNAFAEKKQFILGDEITGSNKREHADYLKSMITRSRVEINAKYMPTYFVDDIINYYFTSNHPNAFFLDDHDRRMFVHQVMGEPLPKIFYDQYDKWMNSEGPAALFDYFLKLDIKEFQHSDPALKTEARQTMITDGKYNLTSLAMA